MMMKKMKILPMLLCLGLGQLEAKTIQADVAGSSVELAQKTVQKNSV